MYPPFRPKTSQNVLLTTVSQEITLDEQPHVMITGEGAQTAYIRFSRKGGTAVTTDIAILSGEAMIFSKPDDGEFLEALCNANTSRLNVVTGRCSA